MSVKSNVERAEESIRKALINALAEGEDHHLTELFAVSYTHLRAHET